MWSTNVENISSRRNSCGLGPHCFQQNKHIPLRKIIIRTTCEYAACKIFNSVILLKSSSTSTFIKLVKSEQTSHQSTRAKWEDCMKAWNYIKNDFDQETGQEYSTKVQIIVKADRGKAIAWCSLSCHMTCYHIPDEKTL